MSIKRPVAEVTPVIGRSRKAKRKKKTASAAKGLEEKRGTGGTRRIEEAIPVVGKLGEHKDPES